MNMGKEISERIYFKKDIEKAFNMGIHTGLAVFEISMGLSYDNQKLVLDRMKKMLVEEEVETVMRKP